MSPAASREYDLTPRQVEILNLIGRGLTNRDIGEVLGISINTVKVHVNALMNALDVSNRTEAVFIYEQLKKDSASRTAEELAIAARAGRPSIAVLPAEFSGAAAYQHLSRALAEELIRRIGAWKWFPVLDFAASAKFAGDALDYAAIRAELGAEYCVTGRIQQLGDGLRVSTTLVHAPTAEVIWSDLHDGSTTDLFTFIDAAARQIVGQMAPELLRRDSEHSGCRSFPAWNEASRAMWHIYVGSREHSAIAAEAWERAIELDPNLVFAWYAKAAGLYQRVFDQWSGDPRADMADFVKAAERCVALDLSDSAAQEICGFARLVSGRLDDAIVHLERAVVLNPSNAQAYSELGQAYTFSGRPAEGIAAFEEALTINPQGDSAWSALSGIGFAHFLLDDLSAAIEVARRAVAINPSFATTRVFLAAYLAADGRLDEAVALREAVLRDDPAFSIRRVTRSFANLSRTLATKFEAAFAAAGFESVRA